MIALTWLLAISSIAHAQQIRGVVQDATGGALPGVTIEAKSDVLIEGVKTAQTDEQGNYLVQDLRPGVYVVSFTLQAFKTVTNKDVRVEADQTTALNVSMSIGAQTEELVVTAAAPTVDVQTAARVTSLDRNIIENMAMGSNIWEMAQLVSGIKVTDATGSYGNSSVGGSNGATQTYMSTGGANAQQNVVMVDGMSVSGLEVNGRIQAYFNNDTNSEVSYQTRGISADRSGGGVTVNMIPREGGNRFTGNGRVSYRPAEFISDNFDRTNTMGTIGDSSLKYLIDSTISQGGPIVRNKVWFFGSFHEFDNEDFVSNTFFDDGGPGANHQRLQQYTARITWQASPKNKVSGSVEKSNKTQNYVMAAGADPETASLKWTTPNYSTGNFKLTSTITSRLLFEGGFSWNRTHRDLIGQPGVQQEWGTPAWYTQVRRTGGGLSDTAPSNFNLDHPGRNNYQASISYVNGSHQIKAGMSYQTGTNTHGNTVNGDLISRFETGTRVGNDAVFTGPDTVLVFNSPVGSRDRLNSDIGVYAQDSWRVKRLTVNYGLRWEHINSQSDAWEAPEGRFVPKRSVGVISNIPDWYDWAPRFSAVYDLFGNARTAIKYGVNRYNNSGGTLLAFARNTLTFDDTGVALDWVDINGDGIPQGGRTFIYNANGTVTPVNCNTSTAADWNATTNPSPNLGATPGCEINLTALDPTNGVYGTPSASTPYEGYPRGWRLEHAFEVQHAITQRFAITFGYTRSGDHDLTKTVNSAIQEGDFLPYTIYHPIDGTPMTYYYPKDAATRSRHRTANVNRTYVEPNREAGYEGYSIEYRVRPYSGAQIFGGYTMDRRRSFDCSSSVPGYVVNPNTLRFCDSNNLPSNGASDSGGTVPFAKDFRLGVSLPLPWYGLTLGVSYLNNDNGLLALTYAITPGPQPATSTNGGAANRYPDGLSTGVSGFRKIAGGVSPAIPCPAGQAVCAVPGGLMVPVSSITCTANCEFVNPGAASTSAFSMDLYPDGRIRRERLQQVDLKLSKTFRYRSISVLPTLEVFNMFNHDTIQNYTGATAAGTSYATSTGTYLIPSNILQGRIIGLGAQVRW